MKRVLLVVDLQPEFADNKKMEYNKILDYIKKSEYDKVIATRFVNGNKNFLARLNWQLTDKLQPLEFKYDIIIEKTGYGLSESQYNQLDDQCTYDIIRCESDACILKIAMDLFDREFKFNVLKDYIYTNGDLQNEALAILNRNVGLLK